MAEHEGNQTTEQTAPAQQPGGGDAELSRRLQQVEAERDRFRQEAERNAQRAGGMQQFYEQARSIGIEKPEDFEKLKNSRAFIERLEQAGITPDLIANPSGRSDGDELDLDAVVGKTVNAAMAPFHTKDHQSAESAANQKVTEMIGELAGEDSTLKEVLSTVSNSVSLDLREPYDDNHPLAGKALKPLSDSGIKQLRSHLEKIASLREGQKAAAVGDAAARATGEAQKPARSAEPKAASGVRVGDGTAKTAVAQSLKREKAFPPREEVESALRQRIEGRRGVSP